MAPGQDHLGKPLLGQTVVVGDGGSRRQRPPGEPGEEAFLTSRFTRSTLPLVLARYGRHNRGTVPSSSQILTDSGLSRLPPAVQNTVSRSVSSSRLTPPRSSRQRSRRSNVTARVQLLAMRIAWMRL